ncbi:zinc finger and BTB domain-containing protein 25-like [Megalops cyprinoides]|uniref:zinc finger and BTB domain-containing protein 25-like n=1 Tax=Megalops cyprinoides TaxID=118141 RepID=UPI0018648248|nr:zinc finger and BTB domain-containing protein 25-like [Megalops cyprinoides]
MEVSSHSLFLLQQLNVQREFGFLCDCTVAIGNVYFKAHRAVLAAFSNYFKMIFIHQSSECIKIQPTDIQPDVFSYLLHIMYTGTGPKQQVEPNRLQEGIKFLHAYQLCHSDGDQDAPHDSVKMSNLYGIQISSQSAAKDGLGLKGAQGRGLGGDRPGGRTERARAQPPLAGAPEGRPPVGQAPELHGVSSVACGEDPVAAVAAGIKQEPVEAEVSAEPRSPAQTTPSPCLFKDSPRALRCQHCGEQCGTRQGLREHLFAHATSSPPFGAPAAAPPDNVGSPGEALKGPAGEELEELEGSGERLLGGRSPSSRESEPGGLEEALRQSRALAEELAAELRGGGGSSPRSRKRRIVCAVCGLRFGQKVQLQEHMYSHTGKSSRYHRYSRLCSQLIQASQHFCDSQAELAAEEAARDAQDNGSSCYSLDSEISQESIDTFVVE